MNIPINFNYQRFFDLSMDMLCIANTEGYFIQVNESFSRVLGYSRDHFLAQAIMSFIHPHDIESTMEALNRSGKGGANLNFINRYKHINGHYLTLSWNTQTDPDNGLIYGVARDVTEQINQTNRLRQLQHTLDKESIVAVTDKRGLITEVNDRFCEISGYSKEELIGKTHNIISSHSHSKEFFKDLWKTISSKNIWSDVIKNKTKNGGFYYVHTIITPLVDHENEIYAYLSIRQDISKSIKNENDLAKILSILNETSAIAKVGGWELNIHSDELTWTEETFRILDFEKKSGHHPKLPEGLALFTSDSQVIIEKAVKRVLNFGEPYSLELQAKTTKGKVFWVYTNGKANYKNGEIVSISGIIQDIDQRKKAELSYDLERQKSIQSAKFASIGELSASMAHEINNPLGIISGYIELILLSPETNEKLTAKLEVILKSCKRISHIMNSLKKFSRSEEKSEYINCSLSKLTQQAIYLAQPRLKRALVDLEFFDTKNSIIKGCEIEIEQVILNLINNSIDAVKDGPDKWIKLSILSKGEFIELRVIDSGQGISKAIQDKIFSPFFTTKKAGEGTGLGLSIISSILDDHNANIRYEKSDNTTFVIAFPICELINYDI
jgi:PAS domain S-box-containing protein